MSYTIKYKSIKIIFFFNESHYIQVFVSTLSRIISIVKKLKVFLDLKKNSVQHLESHMISVIYTCILKHNILIYNVSIIHFNHLYLLIDGIVYYIEPG
jgi:hypothetical protein